MQKTIKMQIVLGDRNAFQYNLLHKWGLNSLTSPQIEPYTDKTQQKECSGLFWLSNGQDIFVFE